MTTVEHFKITYNIKKFPYETIFIPALHCPAWPEYYCHDIAYNETLDINIMTINVSIK